MEVLVTVTLLLSKFKKMPPPASLIVVSATVTLVLPETKRMPTPTSLMAALAMVRLLCRFPRKCQSCLRW